MRINLRFMVGKPKFFILLAFVLIGVGVFGLSTLAKAASQEGRIISIYDRGVEKVIVTKADTVEGALEQANIQLDPADRVEPDRKTKLIASSYQINVYRARPVVIVDGALEVRIMTADQGGREMAKDAGITLYPEDTTQLADADQTVEDSGAAMRMLITRATPVNLKLYGQATVIRTQKKTVGDMLKEKGITLTSKDHITPAQTTPISPNMNIEIWREGKQTITTVEDVPFNIQRIQDADQFLGYTAVQTPGVLGKKTVTYEIEIKNGVEVSRTQIQSVVTAAPSDEVDVVGIKQKTANPASNRLLGEQLMLNAGFADSQFSCLDSLWTHESGWNQYAANASGAYGIPQALPGSKMGAGWQDDPTVQINWGLGYVKGRYGSPCGAWSYWQAHGWY